MLRLSCNYNMLPFPFLPRNHLIYTSLLYLKFMAFSHQLLLHIYEYVYKYIYIYRNVTYIYIYILNTNSNYSTFKIFFVYMFSGLTIWYQWMCFCILQKTTTSQPAELWSPSWIHLGNTFTYKAQVTLKSGRKIGRDRGPGCLLEKKLTF